MERTTSDDVRRVFENLIDRMNEMGMDTSRTYLTISRDGGAGGPFIEVGNLPAGIGTFQTRGTRNAYDALRFAASVLYAVQKHARAGS